MLGYKGKHFNTVVQEQKATLFADITFLYFVGNMEDNAIKLLLNDGNDMLSKFHLYSSVLPYFSNTFTTVVICKSP